MVVGEIAIELLVDDTLDDLHDGGHYRYGSEV